MLIKPGTGSDLPSKETVVRSEAGLLKRWRSLAFVRASEVPLRRRTTDWVRFVAAAIALVIVTGHAGHPTASEGALFDLLRSLPGVLGPIPRAVYNSGTLWAVALVFAAAVIARRLRLALELLIAGLLARFFSRVLRGIVGARALGLLSTLGPTNGYPGIRVAVIVAVVATASPFITRPTRYVGRFIVVVVTLAGLAVEHFDPNGALAGVVLGWGIAAGLHLVFGSPGGWPATERLVGSLKHLGIVARDVHIDDQQTFGMTVLQGSDAIGPLRIKVFGRDEGDAQLLAKVLQVVLYKDAGPRFFLSRVEQVEHEAYVMLLASSHGVRVPEVVVAGRAGAGAAVLVQRDLESGRLLGDVDAGTLDDDVLDGLWRQLEALHAARVVHGRLDADHIVLTPDGPTIVGFQWARTGAEPRQAAGDVAELLATTSALVGAGKAVDAAIRVLPVEKLSLALPLLQPAALSRRTRHLIGQRRQARLHLEGLREEAARALGTSPPALVQPYRVKRSSILLAIGAFVAAAGLLTQAGPPSQLWEALSSASWPWLAVALGLSLASNVAYAIALQGTVRTRLPLWPTAEVQLAMSFSNLAVPGVGGMAMQIRFLQQQGVDLASAVAAGGLLSTAGNLVVAAALLVVALSVDPGKFSPSLIPTTGLATLGLGLVVLVALASVLIAGIPRLRRVVVPSVRQAASTLWQALREPRLVALLIGGNIAVTLITAGVLAASLAAFDGSAPFSAVLATSIVVSTIAATVPIPGGGNALSAVGLSGALVALGVSQSAAVAATLAQQMTYYYLPAIPGWFAARHLADREYL